MTWAWKSIARGRARLDDVISWSHAGRASPATWQPRRRGGRVKTPPPSAFRSKADGNRLSPITRYLRIVSCARTRGQKKRAPRIGRRRRLKDHRAGRPAAGITVGQTAGDMNGEAQTEGP